MAGSTKANGRTTNRLANLAPLEGDGAGTETEVLEGAAVKRRIGGKEVPAPKEKGAKKMVLIPKLNIIPVVIPVRGITPLLICKFDEKTKREMEEKTEGKAKNKKDPKDPEKEWNAARHVSTDGWDGIHAGGIRAAIIDAARSVDGLTMTELKQAVFVKADGRSKDGTPLVRIHGIPRKFSNMCRTTTGVAYPRHRPMYEEWGAIIELEVNGHILSEEAAINLISLAGFTCGVGEWRPTSPKSKTGDFGRFRIDPTMAEEIATGGKKSKKGKKAPKAPKSGEGEAGEGSGD